MATIVNEEMIDDFAFKEQDSSQNMEEEEDEFNLVVHSYSGY